MENMTLAELAEAAGRGGRIVEEVPPYKLRPGDVIFWEGRWRTVDSTGSYKMKDNRKVFMSAWGYEGKEYVKRFDLPKYHNVLRRII